VTPSQDLATPAKAIIDANVYMVLGTADDDGQPWVSPVFYAVNGYTEFYWISSPEVTHSQNLARRPQASIVIFDSRAVVGTGGSRAVYMSGTADQLSGDDIDRGLDVYPGPAERGGRTMTPHELQPPGPYRLYRITVSHHWMLCPRDSGSCTAHGRNFDHRTIVTL
jgi:hypothetical protein